MDEWLSGIRSRVWNKAVKRLHVSDFRHQIPGLDLVAEVTYMQPLAWTVPPYLDEMLRCFLNHFFTILYG